MENPSPSTEFTSEDAFIGFGSNVGDPEHYLSEALKHLCALSGVELVTISSLYRTEPVGWTMQDWFVNAVAWVKSRVEPIRFMRQLLEIENRMGRRRKVPDGPRVIDLDLLLFGVRVMAAGELQLPHPRFHQRRFVLVPLCEIAPYAVHPVLKKTHLELLDELSDSKAVELLGIWREIPWVGCAGQS